MLEPTLGRRVLSGESGLWASPIRAVLSAGELCYRSIIQIRNKRYDGGRAALRIAVPVVSIGNITVGGTGKTPFVIEIVRRLEAMRCNSAVVARGYGAGLDEVNDEELLVRKHCPGVAYVADADRWRGAERAARQMGADVIVLDDGFQHRRLHRDLDMVLIDAMCPFGYGHVLPRGLLREPLSGLKRADLIVITRSDQVSTNEVGRIENEIRRHNPDAPVIRSSTVVVGMERLDGAPIEIVDGRKRVLAFAAIGRPQAFVSTLSSLGLEVVATRWWPDHHRYRLNEVQRLLEDQSVAPHDLVLTTEKDAVKLVQLDGVNLSRIGVVRIGVELTDNGNHAVDAMLRRVIGAQKAATT